MNFVGFDFGNLVCVKTCYSFKLTKSFFNDQKHKSRNHDISKSPLIDTLGHVDRKNNCSFFDNPLSHNPFLLTEMA